MLALSTLHVHLLSSCFLSHFILSSFSIVIVLSLPSSNDLLRPHLHLKSSANGEGGGGISLPPPLVPPLPHVIYFSPTISPQPSSLSSPPPLLTYTYSVASLFAFLCRWLPPLSVLWTLALWKRVVQLHSSLSDCISAMRTTHAHIWACALSHTHTLIHRSLVWSAMGVGRPWQQAAPKLANEYRSPSYSQPLGPWDPLWPSGTPSPQTGSDQLYVDMQIEFSPVQHQHILWVHAWPVGTFV